MVMVLLILAVLGYRYMQPHAASTGVSTFTSDPVTTNEFNDITPTYVDLSSDETAISPVQPMSTTPSFSCDGRQHCSQMTSCAEATYFSNNCPNTKMDGNNDGVPCERQWC